MKKVFNKFSNNSFGEILKSNGLDKFLKNWDDISKIRNKLIHGEYYTKLPYPDLIIEVAVESLKAFSIIENDILIQKNAYHKIQMMKKNSMPD